MLKIMRAAGLAAITAMGLLGPARAADTTVRPALDGIFAAFQQHPLVGLGDAHGLAEEGELYRQIVRDPRFAEDVGNVVIEAASATHQATLDRYLDGRDVPRAELRKVWSDVVGWSKPPPIMYAQFLAAVREVNLKLPRAKRIKVWAGEPPADWSAIKKREDWEPLLMRRNSYPAAIIEDHILGQGKKALVIYGALHFYGMPTPPGVPPNPALKRLVERRAPNAFYVVHPYFGFSQAGCSAQFEAATAWPPGSLASPVKGTPLEGLLLRDGCTVGRPPTPPPGAPTIAPEALARIQSGFVRPMSGAEADALLYLGPAASLTLSPDDADLSTDTAYAAEIQRRHAITGGSPDLHLVTKPRPYSTRF
jgi:hypothetical protein